MQPLGERCGIYREQARAMQPRPQRYLDGLPGHSMPYRTLSVPRGRCTRAAWPFTAGDGPPARCRGAAGKRTARCSAARPRVPHHSPFAIRHSRFAVFPRSPLATRRLFHSPFAIRHSPSLAARRSLLAARRLSPFAICPFRFFPWRLALEFGAPGPAPRCCSCGAGAVRRSGAILVAPSPPRYSWPSVEGKDRR
jgi:hypothetical protein